MPDIDAKIADLNAKVSVAQKARHRQFLGILSFKLLIAFCGLLTILHHVDQQHKRLDLIHLEQVAS
ncbi:hypothetical protein GOZ97_22775 [Agrobacterium vitis]|uniref:hypothetical protein n=1 Tax=Rhizobium/Agrobacterium group TaxID=227290 RepID=UPI0008DBEDDC|nr:MULTISPECIES: hypothetical protein [Rhizobium/Agrobacterium group]MCF1436815.1 hypothetical protein [Allorhizobium ampelinum]MUO92293.1 hypothetical protein [Agrobacterium vitis]MUZ55114.1 hypothetical protein [Agrobacterium vitis]MUZ94249.1 hypothetical protein [Agrobacterium vitis]MVA42944.1 hypothetical protein [Agrobacterium vitis]